MISVQTNFPVAVESADHLHPEGIYYDNTISWPFVASVENYFKEKINFLDLGCAGGELVCRMQERGHTAVGLEGSDHCLNVREDMINEVGMRPAGLGNWQKYGNKNLFTCDVTKDYKIRQNYGPMTFDLITCWDVMEHFEPQDVSNFLRLVYDHLKPNGIFVASIALFNSGRHAASSNTPENLNYHKSVFAESWWLEKNSLFFNQIKYPFSICNREGIPITGSPQYLVYAGTKR